MVFPSLRLILHYRIIVIIKKRRVRDSLCDFMGIQTGHGTGNNITID